MKILVVTPSYKPAYVYGGTSRSVPALYEHIQASGHEVTLLTTNANGKTKLPVATSKLTNVDGVHVLYFNRWTQDHSNLSPGLLWLFWKIMKEYDVIHLHSWWNLVTMPALLLCRIRGIKPVISPRGMLTAYTLEKSNGTAKRCFHFLFGKSLLKRSFFHVTSTQEELDVSTVVHPIKVFTIANLLSLPDPKQRLASNDHIQLLYLGRIDPKKNIEFLIDVMREIKDISVILHVIGDGDDNYIRQLKESSLDIPGITWHGPLHGDEKWSNYANADMLVLPSFNENYGNVVLESLSQGTAVMISEHVGVKDYVTLKNLGWVLGLQKSDWVETIRQIWQEPMLLHRIREKALCNFSRDFSPHHLTTQYMAMYEEVRKYYIK